MEPELQLLKQTVPRTVHAQAARSLLFTSLESHSTEGWSAHPFLGLPVVDEFLAADVAAVGRLEGAKDAR